MNIKTIFLNFVAFLFIFLFTYTAISKLISFAAFRYSISKSPLIGNYSSWIVVMIPALEFVAAVLLFFPKTKLSGLCASVCLMGAFSLYTGYALLFGLKLPCSCGGVVQSLTWQQHFWLNLALTMLATIAIRLKLQTTQKKINALLQ